MPQALADLPGLHAGTYSVIPIGRVPGVSSRPPTAWRPQGARSEPRMCHYSIVVGLLTKTLDAVILKP